MAQNVQGNTSSRTYPGTASRLIGASPPPSLSSSSSSTRTTTNNNITTGSEPPVRPLSRSQLSSVHIGGSGNGNHLINNNDGQGHGHTHHHHQHQHHQHHHDGRTTRMPIGTTIISGTVGSGSGPIPPPTTTIPTTISTPITSPIRPISLDQPRPNSERNRNLYLGAPVLTQPLTNSNQQQQQHQHHHQLNLQHHSGANLSSSNLHNNNNINNISNSKNNSSVTAAEQVRLPTNSRKKLINNSNNSTTITTKNNLNFSDNTSNSHVGSGGDAVVVTTQPTKRSLLSSNISDSSSSSDENNLNNLGVGLGKPVKLPESSIVCPYCRKCRCQACASPRPLPSRWICSKSVQCGPEPLLDYVTCLCCVKAVFYHCGKNFEPDGGVLCADKPCSCAPHRRYWRWGCMTAMSLFLPCLCLYWPCKGCIHVAEKTYQKYHSNGCTCRSSSSSSAVNSGGITRRDGESFSDRSFPDIFPDEEERSHFSHPNVMMTTANTSNRSNKLLSLD